jgi:hypothetical protein
LLDFSFGYEPGGTLGDEHDEDARDDGVAETTPRDHSPAEEPPFQEGEYHA